jgi:hypothetical protein
VSLQDLERIGGVAINSLRPSTRATYGAGLLAFHTFCDDRGIPDSQRAPVDSLTIQSFVATLAGIYRASSITNYVAAVRAWHLIHGVAWNIGGPEMETVMKGAKAMAPQSSAKEKREPMTVSYIEKLYPQFSDNDPLDVAVFACLTSAFWATARLGELTVRTLKTFDPHTDVKRSDLGEKKDRNGLEVTTIHVPRTKASPIQGEDLYWAKQTGGSDPKSALEKHLALNNPPQDFHLFGFKRNGKMVPLTKRIFQKPIVDCRRKSEATGTEGSLHPHWLHTRVSPTRPPFRRHESERALEQRRLSRIHPRSREGPCTIHAILSPRYERPIHSNRHPFRTQLR